ncbi:MAG: hypothetical protein E7111_06540 [Bacteroidales bacterium]|nr:hypothetical protein [Bacteroidales bacterium]
MKRIVSIIAILILGAAAFSVECAAAPTFPTSGQWSGGTMTQSKTVTLEGHVKIKAPIVIPSGITLTIKKKPGYPTGSSYVQVYLDPDFAVPDGSVHCVFEVQEGGTLKIIGNNIGNDFIAIKGSTGSEPATPMDDDGVFQAAAVEELYNYTHLGYKYFPDASDKTKFIYNFRGPVTGKDSENNNEYRKSGGVLYVVGTLEMECAKIASAFSLWDGAAIVRPTINWLDNSNTKFGPMTLKNVHIRNCYARSAPAIIIYNQRQGQSGLSNTPESCKTTITDCLFYQNYARSSGVCGTIRTGGGVVGHTIITNSNIRDNYVAGYCGGLLASAQGVEETCTTLNGCNIYDNQAGTYAGGAMFSGTFQFTGNVSQIYNNKAATYGGGVYVITYNGVSFSQPKVLDMNFDNKLKIYGNTAKHGGGMCLNFRNTTSLYQNSTINLNIDGTSIYDNTVTANGGGIFLTYNNSKLNINLNIKAGEIRDNKATGGGGGIYCQVGPTETSSEGLEANLDATRCKVRLNGGEIYKNESTGGGGGGIMVSKLPIYCDADAAGSEIYENTAKTDGGGIYITDGATFEMSSGKIYKNTASSDDSEGGGIFCTGESVMTLRDGVIGGAGEAYADADANKAYNGGGIFLDSGTIKLIGGSVKSNNGTNNGGGIYVKNGTLTIESGEVSYNKSGAYGAGIYLANANSVLTVNNGEIRNNTAGTYGGGIFLGNYSSCSLSGGTIDSNTGTYGGGIFVNANATCNLAGGVISKNTATTGGGGIFSNSTVNISGDTKITDNKATGTNETYAGGGGILLSAKGNVTMSEGSPVISGNSAALKGGGIYIRKGNSDVRVNITNGTISGNSAPQGGGLAADAGVVTLNGGVISDNTSNHQGGGIYLCQDSRCNFSNGSIIRNKCTDTNAFGGGVYMNNTAYLEFTNGAISGNEARYDGGGIYMCNGTLSITGGVISGNKAGVCGGGIVAENGNSISVTISNGVIEENSSLMGGGIYMAAGEMDITGGKIISNTSRDGGGIFITGGNSSLTFTDALIINNRAVDRSGKTLSTGYGYAVDNYGGVSGNSLALQGVGGGLFMQNNATVEFSPTSVGIYNNMAETMADDIYSHGNGTTLTLPNVSSMSLSGYNSKTSELYWVEDYMTNDTGYANGTAIAGASHTAVRYRDAIAAQSTVYKVPSGTYTGKYLALSIGHEIIYVTIVRSGLLRGENAVYRIFRWDDNDTPADGSDDKWVTYSELLLYGPEDAEADNAASKSTSMRVALFSGRWMVQEIGWNWTYGAHSAIERDITGSSSAQEKSFYFSSAKKTVGEDGYIPAEQYSESVVTNDFGRGTVEVNKAAPASSSSFETIGENGVRW